MQEILGEYMQMNQLQPKEYGIVFFDTQPHGSKIYVDGQLLTDPDTEQSLKTPERVLLVEGRRNYTFVLEGHKDVSGYVDVLPGTTVNIFRNMEPGKSGEGWGEPEPQIWLSQQQTGIIRIYSFPDGADTYINGRYVGKAPLTVTDVPVGVAVVTWKMTGMMDEEKLVDVHPGSWSDAYATMRPVIPELSMYYQNSLYQDMPHQLYQNTIYDLYQNSLYEVKAMNMGNVTIITNPSGANVLIDGTLMTDDIGNPITTPVTLSLYTGSRFIEICKEGYEIDYYREYIYEGANIKIESNLFPRPYYMSQIPKYAPEYPKIPYYTPTQYMSTQHTPITSPIYTSPTYIPTLYTPIQSMECPSATEGILVITTYPSGATIIMDGKTLIDMETGEPLVTPVDLAVEMGYHDLRFKLKGFFDEFDGVYITPRYHQYRHKNFNIC